MAKDAKGHGSEKRGGSTESRFHGSIEHQIARGQYRGTVVSDMTRSEFIAKHGTTAEKADAGMSDKQAAAVLAQGNPKSAPVDVHPAMTPAHGYIHNDPGNTRYRNGQKMPTDL